MLIRKLQQYKPEKKFLLLKHLEQLGGVEVPRYQAPVMCIWGWLLKKNPGT